MKRTVFQRLMALALCCVLTAGFLPMDAHAEDLENQETLVEGNEEYTGESFTEETYTEEPQTEPASEETEAEQPGLSPQDRQAIVYRRMDSWVFPVAEQYFANISDYCGCRGMTGDLFYGTQNTACRFPVHGTDPTGNMGLHIDYLPQGAEIMAPVDGVLYRISDPWNGDTLIIEQSAGNGYAYYVVISSVSGDVVAADGSNVSAGSVIGTAGTNQPLILSCFMESAGRGAQIARDPVPALENITRMGWLTQEYGTGLICVNPSAATQTAYKNSLVQYIDGPIVYRFVTPAAPEPPAEESTEPSTEATTEPSTEASTEAPHTEHVWDAGNVTVNPTHFAPGEIVYTCTVCGVTDVQSVPATADHIFDQRNEAEIYLAGAASCTTPAVYYYSCICGEKGTETFQSGTAAGHRFAEAWSMDSDSHWHDAVCEHTGEKDALDAHSWDEGRITVQPSHTAAGEAVYTCTVCGATRTETLNPSAEHVYDRKVEDAKYLAAPADCVSPAAYFYSCVCGEAGAETFTVGQALGHTFSDTWTTNDTHHWHAATCAHTTEASGLAAHDWDQGKVTREAGHMVDGETVYTCATCGLTRTEKIPGTSHAFDQEIPEDKYKVSDADCTSPAVYYKSCACGEKGTETFTWGEAKGHTFSDAWTYNDTQHWQAATCGHTNEKIKVADHIWDGGVITVQPTASTRGERTFTCVVCKATKKESLEPTTHEHTFAQNWSGNESYHWHAATCGHTNEVSGFGEHKWDGGVIVSYPSHNTKGETVYTCQTCSAQKRVTTNETHTFNQMIISSAFLKSYATCTQPATYYYSCSCGAKGTETFTTGTAQGHTFANNWNKDDNNHWRTCVVCGTKGDLSAHYYGVGESCQTCGYTKKDSHVHTSHLTRVPAKMATCTQAGNISYYTCECGKWFTDVTATTEITDRSSVVTPAVGHVDKDNNGRCDVCKERLSTETVTYTMTEGADTTWLNNSSQGLVFRCNAEYSKFDHVEVDGATVSSLNYTVSSGSTIVELNASYLKRLTVGQHKLEIVSADGRAAANFSVKQGSASNREEGGRSGLWIVIAVIAIIAMLGAAGLAVYFLVFSKKPAKKGGKFSK